MFKIAGSVIILVAGALFGFYKAAQYVNRVKQIRQLIQAMKRLETEINYGFTPLPEALTRISSAIPEPVSTIFRHSGEQLQSNNGQTTMQSWRHVIQENWGITAMKSIEMEVMLQLGTTLGISDRRDQIKHIQLAANQLQGEEAIAKEDQIRYEKMWKSLGVLGGALVVILMY